MSWLLSLIFMLGSIGTPHYELVTFTGDIKGEITVFKEQVTDIFKNLKIQYNNAKTDQERVDALKQYTALVARYQYGWSKSQFSKIDKIWTQESHWNPKAVNKSSGAWGIAQMLLKTKPGDPFKQINLGLKYINHRYENPDAAHAHKIKHGWY